MRPASGMTVLAAAFALCTPFHGASAQETANTKQAITGGEIKCVNGKAKGFDCQNVDLLSFLPTEAVGAKDSLMYGDTPIILNGIWGWTDSTTNRDFVLLGRVNAAAFIEVTDPVNPKYLGELPLHEGAQPSYWRDMKIYKNH